MKIKNGVLGLRYGGKLVILIPRHAWAEVIFEIFGCLHERWEIEGNLQIGVI